VIKREPREKPATLFDRVAVAVWSGAFALVLGSILWALLAHLFRFTPLFPYLFIVYFAAGMAVLGFLLCENVIVALLVGLMEAVYGVARAETETPPWGFWLIVVIGVLVVVWLLSR
jgi:hypothetical protein